jgi:hypothetical protein
MMTGRHAHLLLIEEPQALLHLFSSGLIMQHSSPDLHRKAALDRVGQFRLTGHNVMLTLRRSAPKRTSTCGPVGCPAVNRAQE